MMELMAIFSVQGSGVVPLGLEIVIYVQGTSHQCAKPMQRSLE